jgi:hypothetical protein
LRVDLELRPPAAAVEVDAVPGAKGGGYDGVKNHAGVVICKVRCTLEG